MSEDDLSSWRQNRREAAAEHAAAFDRRKTVESDQARRLLLDFVQAARDRGLTPVPLEARARTGRATYRTGLTGWYLKRNRTVGVDTAGDFYVLSAPASLGARLTGVTLVPSDPPLVVGAGGRDGESIPLDELLTLRLQGGKDWS